MPKKSLKIMVKDYKCKLFPFEREDCLSMQEVHQNLGWGITAFNLPDAWAFSQGEGIVIGVIDTGCDMEHSDLKDNLLPGFNFLKPNKLPNDDQGHGCVSPETLVHTSISGIDEMQCLYEKINIVETPCLHNEGIYYVKDLSHLDVRTYSIDKATQQSVIGQITSIQKLPINGDVIVVELEGGIEYKFTPWHPVYLSHNKHHDVYEIYQKRADEISLGDHFIFGRGEAAGKLGTTQYIELPVKMKCSVCEHFPKYWRGDSPGKCKKCLKFDWQQVIDRVEITPDLAYLAGIVLTDGYISPDRFEVFSTTPEILERVASIAIKFGWHNTIQLYNNRVLVYSQDAANHLVALGVLKKQKSLMQTLPTWVGRVDFEVVNAFIAGVIDGDGSIGKSNTKNRITTISPDFALKLSALLNSHGITASLSGPIFDLRDRIIKSNYPCYKINHGALGEHITKYLVHPEKLRRSCIVPRSKRMVRRVKAIRREKYAGFFYDFTVKDYHNYIANGHFVSNTHLTGILVACNNDIGMVGIAPAAKVRPIKVLDKDGNGNMRNVAAGIRWAADNGCDFISLSMGAPIPVQEVRKAIQYAHKKGVITFCAAGNVGMTTDVFYPAAYPESIAIGAITEDMHRAEFSNTGKNLDFLAPGVDVYSTVPKNWYAKMSGTSMAQPFACGVAALVKAYVKKHNRTDIPLITSEDYRTLFKKYTIPVRDGNYKDPHFYQGFGIIDPGKFMASIKEPS